MMRLFVALSLPDATADMLGSLGFGLPGARWISADRFHITLRFIGEVDGRTARNVSEELAGITMPSFWIDLHGVGTFGDKRKVHSLWAGVRSNPMLTRLHDKVDAAVARVGLAPDRRKFTPHVTLARLSNPPADRLCGYLAHHALVSPPGFLCDSFVLYSSFLSASGSIYTPEHVYRLDGADDHAWMAQEAENWAEDEVMHFGHGE